MSIQPEHRQAPAPPPLLLGVLAYEPEAEASLAAWLRTDVMCPAAGGVNGASNSSNSTSSNSNTSSNGTNNKSVGSAAGGGGLPLAHLLCVAADAEGPRTAESGGLAAAVTAQVQQWLGSAAAAGEWAAAVTSTSASAAAPRVTVLVVAVFWDSAAEGSRAAFAGLKRLAAAGGAEHGAIAAAVEERIRAAAAAAAEGGGAPARPQAEVEVVVQALNAKRGEHTIRQNRDALVNSLLKKLRLDPSGGTAGAGAGAATTAAATAGAAQPAAATAQPQQQQQQQQGGGGRAALALTTPADVCEAAVRAAVEAGQGECVMAVCCAARPLLEERVGQLREAAAAAGCACTPIIPDPREVTLPAAAAAASAAASAAAAAPADAAPAVVVAQEFLLRRAVPGEHLELRLAMCGNVDSGKSTLTSVLTRGCRDDGRGFARAFVFNHRHEAATGRTSSISENHLGFSGAGEVVNYQAGGAASARPLTPQELSERSAKVLTLYDLAGHERYLKTTVLGMTRNMPDYCCVVISANNGIQRMTKEHLALSLALKLPFFVVVTRTDVTPPNIYAETMDNIRKLLKVPSVRKLPYAVRSADEVVLAARNLRQDRITPIFEVSNVTGAGIAALLRFLNLLPARTDWRAARAKPRLLVIDSTFFVTGVGTVVGGVVAQGVFTVGDTLLLGPDGTGHYRPVVIKSIHVKGVDVPSVAAGNDAALCLKKEKRSAIRKGNILADPASAPGAFWQFEAEVTILYHSTTIAVDYEPVIHSTTVRQSARITHVAQEVLRTGDRSLVRFHFLYRPEFMAEGQRLIFREGRTKGIGVVTRLIPEACERLLSKPKRSEAP